MKTDNDANYIKWLLTDQIVDLVAAVGMGRTVIADFCVNPTKVDQAMGRLRVCNHSIILSLFKLYELRHEFGQFLNTLPKGVTENLYRYSAEIADRNICNFRNKYAAHIFEPRQKANLHAEKKRTFGNDHRSRQL